MTEVHRLRLVDPQQAHAAISALYATLKPLLLAGHAFDLTAKPETRSTAQNRLMWGNLADISRQVDWYGRKLSPEAWKCIFSASLRKQDVVPGLHKDFVVLGESTSKMTVRDMSDLIDLMSAFGAEKGVRFTAYEQEVETI